MKVLKEIGFVLSIICAFALSSNAQQRSYDVRFVLNDIDCNTRQACWDVQVQSGIGSNFDLADQNYRLYFDADELTFVSSASKIVANGYTGALNTQTIPNGGAPVNGQLMQFGQVGFHEYAINWTGSSSADPILNISTWTTTSEVCFTVSNSIDLSDPASCVELVWGRDGVTNTYTAAYVQITEFINNSRNPQVLNNAIDLSGSADDACFHESCPASTGVLVKDVTVTEGVDANAQVEICSSPVDSQNPITVNYSTSDNTAMSGSDYTSVTSSVIIPAGQECVTVSVPIVDDAISETTESFNVNIVSVSGNSNPTISDDVASVNVMDNDGTPVVNITTDPVVNEDAGTATVTVCVTPRSASNVTFSYSSQDATATGGSDYTAQSSTLTIPATDADGCIDIVYNIIDDSDVESTESFNVQLSNIIGANSGDISGSVMILDNDVACNAQAPTLTK